MRDGSTVLAPAEFRQLGRAFGLCMDRSTRSWNLTSPVWNLFVLFPESVSSYELPLLLSAVCTLHLPRRKIRGCYKNLVTICAFGCKFSPVITDYYGAQASGFFPQDHKHATKQFGLSSSGQIFINRRLMRPVMAEISSGPISAQLIKLGDKIAWPRWPRRKGADVSTHAVPRLSWEVRSERANEIRFSIARKYIGISTLGFCSRRKRLNETAISETWL